MFFCPRKYLLRLMEIFFEHTVRRAPRLALEAEDFPLPFCDLPLVLKDLDAVGFYDVVDFFP